MPQSPSQQDSSPNYPPRVYVDLPEEPPEVTEPVAGALLYLLHVLIADPSRPRLEIGDGEEGRAAAGSSQPFKV